MTTAYILALSPQARKIYDHMKSAGSISAREAMADYGITSATLARRVCDIEEQGFLVERETRDHPIHKRRYTRYSVRGHETDRTAAGKKPGVGGAATAPAQVSGARRLKAGDRVVVTNHPSIRGLVGVIEAANYHLPYPLGVRVPGAHSGYGNGHYLMRVSEVERVA
jgi:hypothetical protein